MKIFLAGTNSLVLNELKTKINVLESFAYISKHLKTIDKLLCNEFLLDSGAFTFFGNSKISLNEYIDKYIHFINKYDIKNFFELDLYTLPEYGIKKTEEIRDYIEKKTGKQTIPVFHKMLGIEYYKKLCENYKYIAISASGMYDSKWTRKNPEQLKKMVLYANSKNVKVHGLGYTKMILLKEIPFYSIDSTTWLNAGKFGELQYFDGVIIKKIQAKSINKQTIKINQKKMLVNNFNEWVKFQKYAEQNL